MSTSSSRTWSDSAVGNRCCSWAPASRPASCSRDLPKHRSPGADGTAARHGHRTTRSTRPARDDRTGEAVMQTARDDRSLGDLFAELSRDATTLIRKEIELAKTET